MCKTIEEAEAYFTKGGPPLTTTILRKFIYAAAVSGLGYIENRVSATSLDKLLKSLSGQAKVDGNPIHRDVLEATSLYVYGPLVTTDIVHLKSKVKVTAIPSDLTAFMKAMFTPRFASDLCSTRDLLQLALFVCLQFDCSNRVSELLMMSMSTKNIEKHKREQPDKAFVWSCVEVYAFRSKQASS